MPSSPPPSAAAVLEYLCLFTHDLRRKQKRWQDGRLKYHAFNKRVMVYDERGNFVGDMHWRYDYAFDEGEEIELERGVIVQVSTLVARRETDLSELLDKRVKEKEQRHLQKLARSPAPTAALPRPGPRPSAIPPDHFQLRHRPLHQVIGTPTGHHGKALVPNESPFEQRQQAAAAVSPDERAAKRRKQADPPSSKSGYATSLFGQSLTLSATSTSSVPVKRRPRPELNSDPPLQADGSSPGEEVVPASREQPKMPRQLNQKSGYAQGLFGQSLTLSHTHVSSVRSRRQLRQEHSPSSTLDADTREGHGDAQPALREQPKASRHFNQPSSRLQAGRSEEGASTNRKTPIASNELAEGIIPRRKLKENRTIPRDRRIEESKHVAPKDDDVIEIVDPDPVLVQPVRQSRREKGTRDTARVSKKTDDRSNVTKPRQNFSRGKSTSSRSSEREDEQESEPEKREVPTQPKTAKPVTIKPATKKRTADRVAPRTNEEPPRHIGTSRRPDEHVTELKLKSRKRGLLMISDASKKSRRQATGTSAGPFDVTQGQDADEIYGGLSNFSTLNANGELEDEEPGEDTRRSQPQRTISTELGEVTDLFRSSSPAPQEKSLREGKAPTEDSSDQQKQSSTEVLPKPDKDLADDGDAVFGKDVIIDQAPSPQINRVYDPYRIPSSSEDDAPFPWPASSPGNKTPPNNSVSKQGPADGVRDARKAGHKPNTAMKTKQQRPSRRKFILEDDDEPAVQPGCPERTLVSLDAIEDNSPSMNEAAPAKQSKKTAEAKQRMADLEGNDDESVKATKQKAKEQQNQAHPESQDEQAGKRRRSTRQRRNRVDESEEPSLASELDVSEEEQAPKKRQCRTSKAAVNRPRLERLKKNIKSRELIGFNLAPLNAPLGPRGIGMPFSILSSPMDESIQRRMSNQAVMEASSDPIVEDIVEQTSTAAFSIDPINAGPDRILLDGSLAAVLSGQPTTSTPDRPAVTTQFVGLTTKNEEPHRVVGNKVRVSPVQAPHETMTAGVQEQLAAGKKVPANASGSGGPNTMNHRSGRTPDAPETKDSASIVLSLDHSIATEQRADDCDARHAQAKTHMPQAVMDEDSAISAVSTDNPAAQNAEFSDQRPRSNAAGNTSQEKGARRVASESTETTQTTSALPIAAAMSTIRLQASTSGLHRRASTNETGNNTKSGSGPCKAGTTGSIRSNEPATTVAQMSLGPPAQKSTSVIQQQPSTTAQEDDGKPEGAYDKPDASEDIQVERTAGSTARPRVTVPFKRPTPAMRRQPSITTAANEIHTRLIGEGPDTTEDGQGISTYASTAAFTIGAPLQEPTLMSVGASPNIVDSTKGDSETYGEKPETGPNQRLKSVGLRRPIAASRRVNNITGVRPQIEVPEDQTADSAAKATVKIVNPASRGRKAALASDAVGQVPQRVLPPSQPPLLVPISTADLACTPYEPPPKEPERPKRKMKFPGFQSARGEGPWSREAFDLLESGRPD